MMHSCARVPGDLPSASQAVLCSLRAAATAAILWTASCGTHAETAGDEVANQKTGGSISIVSADVTLKSHVYRLDANIDYQLSGAALEALTAGVPLTIVLETQVKRERPLMDERISATETRYLLHKHDLSGRFLLTDLEDRRVRSFENFDSLVENFGRLRGYPMVSEAMVPEGHRYRMRLRVRLDIESLPAVLRPLAYLNADWRMNSGWHSWKLEQ